VRDGSSMLIEWGQISGWCPIDEDCGQVPIMLSWLPERHDTSVCF
jgi:hypothetical protein